MRVDTAMLITVGLSLRDNVQKEYWRNLGELKSEDSILLSMEKYYNDVYPDLRGTLNSTALNSVSFPSAEIQTFCYWLKQFGEEIMLKKVILMPTKVDKAVICAKRIERILKDEVFQSRLCTGLLPDDTSELIEIRPFQLRIEDEALFTQDVAAFLEYLEALIRRLEGEGIHRKYLNITGGYKGLVPIFSLFGFIQEEDLESVYQHEEGESIIRIPPLPLAWDMKLFDEYRSLLGGRDELNFEPPAKFRLLFEEKDGLWEKNPFGEFLEKIYDRDKLKRFGYGARLVRRLKDTSLQNKIREGADRWQHIWIGDQIPETVEHSRGHSMRLLVYGADILEPMLETNPDFLQDDDLYLLICCMWLHDIGHTVLEYTLQDNTMVPVTMFPSLVREWHSILSYECIKATENDYLSEDEREAVALISKYHRGCMPLREQMRSLKDAWENRVWDKVFGIKVDPLETVLGESGGLAFRGNVIDIDKALFLCALLRIIDGCDVQLDRVVDDNYLQERKQRCIYEVDTYQKILEKRHVLLELCSDINEINKLIDYLNDCIKFWKTTTVPNAQQAQLEEVKNRVKKIEKAIFGEVENGEVKQQGELKKTLGLKDAYQVQIRMEILSLINRIAFKMQQEAHYRKHSQVKLVYITYEPTDSGVKYQIHLVFDEDEGAETASVTIEDKREIAKDIFKEIVLVGDILRSHGMEFEGVFWQGENLIPEGGEAA